MKVQVEKTHQHKNQLLSEQSTLQLGGKSRFQIIDNRPEAIAQKKLQDIANNNPQTKQLQAYQEMASNTAEYKQMAQWQAMACHSQQHKQIAQWQAMADNCSSQQQPIQRMVRDNEAETQAEPIQLAGWGAALGGVLGAGAGVGIGAMATLSNPITAGLAIVMGLGGAIFGHIATEPERIPNAMHFVWMGGTVPEARRNNMAQWTAAIGAAQVNLWLDAPAMLANAELLEVMRAAGINIRSIADELQPNSPRLAQRIEDMATVDAQGVNPPVTGALSDVVRLEILSQFGGTYMDSDNTPGPNANTFEDREAPMGLRLGFGTLNGNQAFSNDAMASMVDDPFINAYLNRVYENLNVDATRGLIAGRTDASRDAVMRATGPEAMANVLLPLSAQQLAAVNRDLNTRTQFDNVLRDQMNLGERGFEDGITIRDIGLMHANRGIIDNGDAALPELNSVMENLAFGNDTFTRELGNAWVI